MFEKVPKVLELYVFLHFKVKNWGRKTHHYYMVRVPPYGFVKLRSVLVV